jgi:hypothetical protein
MEATARVAGVAMEKTESEALLTERVEGWMYT